MKSAKRRGFLCLALSTLSGLPYLNTFGLTANWADISLSRADVESGLKRGLEFRDHDKEVLSFLKKFSDRQVMVGGGVLTKAAELPTEWIHLLVRLDSLKKFSATMSDPDVPWAGAQVSHGTTLAFEYEGQKYYIETLLEEDFLERLKSLKEPGSETNGFRLEFAHDALLYDLQKRRYSDPFDAIGRSNQIELKRIAPPNGIPSAMRILIEEKALGMAIPRKERQFAERTIQGHYAKPKDSQENTMKFLSGVSRLAEHVDPSLIRDVMTSELSEETVEENIGEDVRKFASLRNRLEGAVSSDSTEGALWHLSMRCLEDTNSPECEVEVELSLHLLGGYDDFYTKRDLALSAKELAENGRVIRERTKQNELDRNKRMADSAPTADHDQELSSNEKVIGNSSSAKILGRQNSSDPTSQGRLLRPTDPGPILSPLRNRTQELTGKANIPKTIQKRLIRGK